MKLITYTTMRVMPVQLELLFCIHEAKMNLKKCFDKFDSIFEAELSTQKQADQVYFGPSVWHDIWCVCVQERYY